MLRQTGRPEGSRPVAGPVRTSAGPRFTLEDRRCLA
jgi:hypothetical protein